MMKLVMTYKTPIMLTLVVEFLTSLFLNPAYAAVTLNLPQIPLITATSAHPQVLIAIGNSQSMDGLLSGAIMPGSGLLSSSLISLNNSSSPLTYSVPTNFTPPAQVANAQGMASYTVNVNGTLVDNSPSRLNVAKAAIQAIIQNYIATTDFALMGYNTGSSGVYSTWVYYMSPPGSAFDFTNNQLQGNRYVDNPCYKYTSASSTVKSNCKAIDTLYSSSVNNSQYMQISATSDDPDINDVLYASGLQGVFLTYNGPNPASPYPPNFSLSNYNSGNILVRYNSSQPNSGGFATSPTNAGYVPFSQQVMYALRGFGYYASVSANSGTIMVPMTTAGTNPTQTSITNAINLFLPKLKPQTNNANSTEIKSLAVQSATAGMLTTALSYLNTLPTTNSSGCPQKKYVILISDGLPTKDLSGKSWPPLGSAAATGYGLTATFNPDGSLNTTNSQALTNTISALTNLKNSGIITYVIGLGAGVDRDLNPQAAATLTAMAVAGGSGSYFPATSPDALIDDLNNIMTNIQDGAYSATAASVNSTQLNTNSVQYVANFVSSDSPYQDWTGNLSAQTLNAQTGTPMGTTLWSAQSLLDTQTAGNGWSNNRRIATWNAVSLKGIPFQWSSLNATQQGQLKTSSNDTNGPNRLAYLRGNNANEVRNGGAYRNRSHILGDIIYSQPAYVGAPSAPYMSASYISFQQSQASRQPMIYAGANDGMLHAFNATSGAEMFAYVPNDLFPNLINLTTPVYNQTHLYFVDGSPQTADVQFPDSSWHTILVGSENTGGNSIFALDVTNPASISTETALASNVLWEYTDVDMGFGINAPRIAQIQSDQFAVFFGNGYNNPNNKSILYALNPKTGAVLAKINLCAVVPSACNASNPQGLSSVTTANSDGLQTQPITNVYAGDLQGNLWSINVTSSNPAQWTTRLLFQAKDAGGSPQAITTAPVVTLNPHYPKQAGLFVLFGTGQLLTTNDLLTTQTQTLYGVWDNPGVSSTYNRSNLQQQTLTSVTTTTSEGVKTFWTATSNPINWSTLVGWYDDLPVAGMRLITTPTLYNKAFIATLNTPPLSACSIIFSAMLVEINYATGGELPMPLFDINGDGLFTILDQINGTNPIGISLYNNYANSPTLMGNNSSGNMVISITQANGSQTAIPNPNLMPGKTGWIQIQ